MRNQCSINTVANDINFAALRISCPEFPQNQNRIRSFFVGIGTTHGLLQVVSDSAHGNICSRIMLSVNGNWMEPEISSLTRSKNPTQRITAEPGIKWKVFEPRIRETESASNRYSACINGAVIINLQIYACRLALTCSSTFLSIWDCSLFAPDDIPVSGVRTGRTWLYLNLRRSSEHGKIATEKINTCTNRVITETGEAELKHSSLRQALNGYQM